MASISFGGQGPRKALDSAIPLVPFIDLLLCCVMFLLVTAVWNQLGEIKTTQRVPSPSMDVPQNPDPTLTLTIHRDGFELTSALGERKQLDSSQDAELRSALVELRKFYRESRMTVATDDGVKYASLIRALDLARDVGFQHLDVVDASRP